MSATPADRWLAFRTPRPQARLRLFCFPYAGGAASIYRVWPQQLPAEVEVCPVQLPGRESRLRESPFRRVGLMVETLAQALSPHLGLPFAFFGHSMGGLIAFELARQLRRLGLPGPLVLIASGRRAPHVPDEDPPIHDLPEPEFIEELRRLNGTPEEVLAHPELLQLLIPLLRADFEVNETYVYQPEEPLTCPIAALGGLGDQDVPREHVEAWREHTRGDFVLRMFPGDHFFIHSAQRPVLDAVSQDLLRALARLGSTVAR